jgi:hypothetical protein
MMRHDVPCWHSHSGHHFRAWRQLWRILLTPGASQAGAAKSRCRRHARDSNAGETRQAQREVRRCRASVSPNATWR